MADRTVSLVIEAHSKYSSSRLDQMGGPLNRILEIVEVEVVIAPLCPTDALVRFFPGFPPLLFTFRGGKRYGDT